MPVGAGARHWCRSSACHPQGRLKWSGTSKLTVTEDDAALKFALLIPGADLHARWVKAAVEKDGTTVGEDADCVIGYEAAVLGRLGGGATAVGVAGDGFASEVGVAGELRDMLERGAVLRAW